MFGKVSICEPAPEVPTTYSLAIRSSQVLMPDVCHATQMPLAVLMLPSQFILRGSKVAPSSPYSGANGTLECTRPMVVPSFGATLIR